MARESFLHRMERNRREQRLQAQEAAAFAETKASMKRIDRQEWIANWRAGLGGECSQQLQRSAAA